MRGQIPLIGIDVLKDALGMSSADSDTILRRLVVAASNYFESAAGVNRRIRQRTYTDEKYSGGGSAVPGIRKRLYLDNYPVVSVASLYDDPTVAFGSSTLFASTDFDIFKKRGYIQLRNDSVYLSRFNFSQQNIKITYDAGYGIDIQTGINDRIDFDEGSSALVATLTEAQYTPEALATEVSTQMTSAGTDFTCTYDEATEKFAIAQDTPATFNLLWTSGANEDRSAGKTLGFDVTADDGSATTYTADDLVTGIPEDIVNAVIEIAMKMFKDAPKGDNRFLIKSETMNRQGTRALMTGQSEYVKDVISAYKRILL